MEDKLRGILIGLSVGDALGMPLKFKHYGSFEPITGYIDGGPHNLPRGYWTDETTMTLCFTDSILAKGGYDSYDIMQRLVDWQSVGHRSSTGVSFDLGSQITSAIHRFKQDPIIKADEKKMRSSGNGTIVRLAPMVIAAIASGLSEDELADICARSARETHFSGPAEETAAAFSRVLYRLTMNSDKAAAIDLDEVDINHDEIKVVMNRAKSQSQEQLNPSTYALDTIEVALWAFLNTDSFQEGMLKAVNMGGDSDAVGAVYGQLAGAFYGVDGIPQEWRDGLYDIDEIDSLAKRLANIKDFKILKTRFEEDN